jgi:hypothetical protein
MSSLFQLPHPPLYCNKFYILVLLFKGCQPQTISKSTEILSKKKNKKQYLGEVSTSSEQAEGFSTCVMTSTEKTYYHRDHDVQADEIVVRIKWESVNIADFGHWVHRLMDWIGLSVRGAGVTTKSIFLQVT